jgi:hypothetical protein
MVGRCTRKYETIEKVAQWYDVTELCKVTSR